MTQRIHCELCSAWPVGLEVALARIEAGPAPTWFRDQFRNDLAALVALFRGTQLVAHVLVRREHDPADFVILAAVSHVSGDANLTADCLPALEGLARLEGCEAVRWHTTRPGLVELGGRHGYQLQELVLRKQLGLRNARGAA